MELQLKIPMNHRLFIRDPEETELGKKIIEHSILLIHKIGFEAFTFKKVAAQIKTTEAGIYRYFENKHLLLIYLVDWYWSWQAYRLTYNTKNLNQPKDKLSCAIALLSSPVMDDIATSHIKENLLYDIVMAEGAKSYLTRNVAQYNEAKLFKPYKDFCGKIAEIISEYNPNYKFPRSLASTIIEMAHSQSFYQKNLPSLTDFGNSKDEGIIAKFLEEMVLAAINKA